MQTRCAQTVHLNHFKAYSIFLTSSSNVTNGQACVAYFIIVFNRLHLSPINLICTSGGALVAINVALKRPNLVEKVIVDSSEGEKAI